MFQAMVSSVKLLLTHCCYGLHTAAMSQICPNFISGALSGAAETKKDLPKWEASLTCYMQLGYFSVEISESR